MITLKGIGIFKDIAFGTLSIHKKSYDNVTKYSVKNTEQEIERFKKACDLAIAKTDELYKKTLEKLSDSEATIFSVHKMMIQDKDYRSSIINIINTENSNAEYAVWKTSQKFAEMFSQMDDLYMRSRDTDIIDIAENILDHLYEKNEKIYGDNIIVGANDLTPSDVSGFDKSKIKGFITSAGSICSHAAIIARVMGIPAVVGLGNQIKPEYEGREVIIDGFSGKVYIEPDEFTSKKFKQKKKQIGNKKELLKHLKGKESVTKDGHKISIFANINNDYELDEALENDLEGIGLLRSEFLYLNRKSYPSEEEQFEIYKKILTKMGNKDVIIRTLDIGSDKRADYFNLPEEDNPAMGYRGIRVCLKNPEIFITQLRAIYRASVFGKASIMFPMIISVEEVLEIKKYLELVKKDLSENNIPFSKNVKVGVMIETPAAVLISDCLAKEVDFFSIGTNDLAQYSLAVDRQNNQVGHMFDPGHKSILRMIKMTVDNAHKNGIWAGICGEAAADEIFTETFLALGVDKLSMAAPFILSIRKKVIDSNIGKVQNKILKYLDC